MSEIHKELRSKSPAELAKIWGELVTGKAPIEQNLEIIYAIGDVLLTKGESLLTVKLHNQLPESLRKTNARILQNMGLALARTGAIAEAQKYLEPLLDQLCNVQQPTTEGKKVLESTLMLVGRGYKDLGLPLKPGDPIRDTDFLERANQCYEQAYNLRFDFYPGINLAFTSRLLRQIEKAQEVARNAYDECHKLLQSNPLDYWIHATVGEAALHLGLETEARVAYAEAGQLCRRNSDYGSLSSTIRQLRYLLAALGRSPSESELFIKCPRVAICAGHMVDCHDRPNPRFPESQKELVRQQIADWLKREDIEIGFSSAACGTDLLFIDALLERGGKSNVYLPFAADDFRSTSVAFTGSDYWPMLFDNVKKQIHLQTVSDRKLSFGEIAYSHANQLLFGAAIIEAERMGMELKHLLVWNGEQGDGYGGTSDVLHQWVNSKKEVDVILVPDGKPAEPFRTLGRPLPRLQSPKEFNLPDFSPMVAGLLFADVKGFSTLEENQVPKFVSQFLGQVAEILRDKYKWPGERNTWGDGIYIAFDSIRDAGMFALDLAEMVRETHWEDVGLPANLKIRTALHAGPVYRCTDPLTLRPNCIGTNVSHVARLEPSTPENEVYASFEFAALSAMEGITDYTCQYVGNLDWAKGYGTFPTYHVRRA